MMLSCKTADCSQKGKEYSAPECDLYCGVCGQVMTA